MAIFSSKNLIPEAPNAAIKAHTVLLVDDEEANLRVMTPLLSRSCHVITASNGRVALSRIEEMGGAELSMIITDQRMPELTGVELLERVVDVHPDTIRIIVSGFADMSVVLAAINKAKIYHFITKPFEASEFLITVKQALRSYDFKKEAKSQVEALQAQLSQCQDARQRQQLQLDQALAQVRARDGGADAI